MYVLTKEEVEDLAKMCLVEYEKAKRAGDNLASQKWWDWHATTMLALFKRSDG